MAESPARVRKRISHELPVEERSSRRTAWWIGGLLGVLVGAVVAFFVVPPLMNQYFGTADVGLGTAHSADGGRYTLTAFDEEPGLDGTRTLVATFEVASRSGAEFGLAAARLRLEGGAILPPARPSGSAVPDPLVLEAGASRTVELRFSVPAGLGSKAEYIEFSQPRVRFHVEPGEPE
ncbi:MAG: hypothetical protein ACKVVT_17750 [Dehalococcoidia bacterium]